VRVSLVGEWGESKNKMASSHSPQTNQLDVQTFHPGGQKNVSYHRQTFDHWPIGSNKKEIIFSPTKFFGNFSIKLFYQSPF
jgi:hypothetical protein